MAGLLWALPSLALAAGTDALGQVHKQAARFALQVAIILLAAKVAGRLFRRYLKQPPVLGEVSAGILIGPYALGALPVPGVGPLFPAAGLDQALSGELHGLAIIASVVLLFVAGLETDVKRFLRYTGAGLLTGLGGAALSFFLGAGAVVWFGFSETGGFLDPAVLIMGAVATATSVGITARVLSERDAMNTPEGSTIFAAAVIDDILGLVSVAVVLKLIGRAARPALAGIALDIGWALVFWAILVAIGLALHRLLGRFLRAIGGGVAAGTGAFALALLASGVAEEGGLALIVGAYTMGLALSKLDMAHELRGRLAPVYDFLVPIFFCTSGMMVNFSALNGSVLLFGAAFTAACVIGKVAGCGLPAIPLGFNVRGALRIGVGMLPRQEVALIVAGLGVATGTIGPSLFSAVILMAFATTAAAPVLLARLFDGASGLRAAEKGEAGARTERLALEMPSPPIASLVTDRLLAAFREEQFFVRPLRGGHPIYELRKEDFAAFLDLDGARIGFSVPPAQVNYIRFVVLEEIVSLAEIFREASDPARMEALKRTLALDAGAGL